MRISALWTSVAFFALSAVQPSLATAQGAATPREGGTYRMREDSHVVSRIHLSFPASPSAPVADRDLDQRASRSMVRRVTLLTWAPNTPPELEIVYESFSVEPKVAAPPTEFIGTRFRVQCASGAVTRADEQASSAEITALLRSECERIPAVFRRAERLSPLLSGGTLQFADETGLIPDLLASLGITNLVMTRRDGDSFDVRATGSTPPRACGSVPELVGTVQLAPTAQTFVLECAFVAQYPLPGGSSATGNTQVRVELTLTAEEVA